MTPQLLFSLCQPNPVYAYRCVVESAFLIWALTQTEHVTDLVLIDFTADWLPFFSDSQSFIGLPEQHFTRLYGRQSLCDT
jgi:hypothetical protein